MQNINFDSSNNYYQNGRYLKHNKTFFLIIGFIHLFLISLSLNNRLVILLLMLILLREKVYLLNGIIYLTHATYNETWPNNIKIYLRKENMIKHIWMMRVRNVRKLLCIHKEDICLKRDTMFLMGEGGNCEICIEKLN